MRVERLFFCALNWIVLAIKSPQHYVLGTNLLVVKSDFFNEVVKEFFPHFREGCLFMLQVNNINFIINTKWDRDNVITIQITI